MKTRDLIVQLLGSVTSRKEVQHYLERYAHRDDPAYIIVKVGGQIIRDDLDALADALAFLHELHVRVAVVHGAGPQLNAALKAQGITAAVVDGLRTTPPEVLQVARRVFGEVGHQLVDALTARGVTARPLSSSVVEATPHRDGRLGLVGEVQSMRLGALRSAQRAGAMPIIGPLGESAEGQIYNVNADVVTAALATSLDARKVVFLSETGALLDAAAAPIAAINLDEDGPELMRSAWLSGGMRLKLEQIGALLDKLGPRASVSITRPAHLTRELFTHQGAGTLVRKGERVRRFQGFHDVDTARLRALITECFGRPPVPTYFSDKTPLAIYTAGDMRAVAVVTTVAGTPYLDKFAVTKAAQGEGVGGLLWAHMRRDHPRLLWRSRRDNPINAWYFKQADGCLRDGRWVIFWTGDEPLAAMAPCIDAVRALPPSLEEDDQGATA